MADSPRVRSRLPGILTVSLLAMGSICISRSTAGSGDPQYVRVAAGISAIAMPAANSLRAHYAMRRYQFDPRPDPDPHPGPDPWRPNSEGCIVEVAPLTLRAENSPAAVWRFVYPLQDAYPRLRRSEALSWDSSEDSLWAFVVYGDYDGIAHLHAFQIPSRDAAVLPPQEELLAVWPATAGSQFKFDLPPDDRRHDWGVDHIYPVPDSLGFLIAMSCSTNGIVRWVRFEPKSGTWSRITATVESPTK